MKNRRAELVMLGANRNMRCEAIMNTHLAMGWTPCGKPATTIVTKLTSDFALCDEHAKQNADLPSRPIPEKAAVEES